MAVAAGDAWSVTTANKGRAMTVTADPMPETNDAERYQEKFRFLRKRAAERVGVVVELSRAGMLVRLRCANSATTQLVVPEATAVTSNVIVTDHVRVCRTCFGQRLQVESKPLALDRDLGAISNQIEMDILLIRHPVEWLVVLSEAKMDTWPPLIQVGVMRHEPTDPNVGPKSKFSDLASVRALEAESDQLSDVCIGAGEVDGHTVHDLHRHWAVG
jgi:hypothetical protein